MLGNGAFVLVGHSGSNYTQLGLRLDSLRIELIATKQTPHGALAVIGRIWCYDFDIGLDTLVISRIERFFGGMSHNTFFARGDDGDGDLR